MTSELQQNIISFVVHNPPRVEVHRHHCFQIVISLRGTFSCTIAGTALTQHTGFIVNQNIAHSCQAGAATVLVFFIDAESYHGWQLRALLAGRPFLDTAAFFTEVQSQELCADGNERLSRLELQQIAGEIFASILPAQLSATSFLPDDRISRATRFIDAHLSESLRLEDLAEVMGLSPERARHLFAQTTGSPFSQYLLWKRIKQVIVTVQDGKLSLTEAALQFGFADQAHFCRVFKRTFGMAPKTLLKNSRFVQFLTPFPP
ncbi:MAG: AraC family transcriptional regulator [Blastocatellia bacterium]